MKKIFLSFLIGCSLLVLCPSLDIHAAEENMIYESISENNLDVTRADVIETKYRVNNGVLQYRRWNASRNVWVDPYWIDL